MSEKKLVSEEQLKKLKKIIMDNFTGEFNSWDDILDLIDSWSVVREVSNCKNCGSNIRGCMESKIACCPECSHWKDILDKSVFVEKSKSISDFPTPNLTKRKVRR